MSGVESVLWIAAAAVIILLDLWAIISVFRSDKGVEVKSMWAIGIALFPLLGLALWGLLGPRGVASSSASGRSG